MKNLFNLRIVSISHYQSCTGTLYLHSLLDGHPQICTIPGVPNLMPLLSKKYSTPEEALHIFEDYNPKFYDTNTMTLVDENNSGFHNLGKSMNEGIITDKKIFRDSFFSNIKDVELSKRNVIISIYLAYSISHNTDLDQLEIILLHPHEPSITFEFHKIFPESQ